MTANAQEHAANNIATLVRMANEIATYFQSYPKEKSVPAVAEHINLFWNRSMRADFLTHAKNQEKALDPLVLEALSLIKPAERSKGTA